MPSYFSASFSEENGTLTALNSAADKLGQAAVSEVPASLQALPVLGSTKNIILFLARV